MATILSRAKIPEQEQEEFATVSTISNRRAEQKFPGYPIAIIRPIRSIAQISDKDADDTESKSYYISPRYIGSVDIFLPSQPYELRTIEEQSKELKSDDIAVYVVRSIGRQNVSFVQPLSSVRRGRFLSSLLHSFSAHFPQSKSKLQDSELDEEQLSWRGVFPLSNSTKILFAENVEIKVDELPTWKPNVVIDSYRLEDDDE
jgi:hypothetical protein